ncbi:MAG: toxin-antitoxin system HicB family antitoxin, partial [Planctomycetales bacterium]|nr:toxin-antitoxin system HicB family antitoxin [Planctomycetales bacterium]
SAGGVSQASGGLAMSAISLRLSESLHKQVRELARREGISINQLISSAVAEKLSALMTEEYLETRAKRGNRAAFDDVLSRVRDVDPDEGDGLDS